MPFSITPIGIVHSTFEAPEGMPIQAALSDAVGTLEIYPEYADGLSDIAGFDYLFLRVGSAGLPANWTLLLQCAPTTACGKRRGEAWSIRHWRST